MRRRLSERLRIWWGRGCGTSKPHCAAAMGMQHWVHKRENTLVWSRLRAGICRVFWVSAQHRDVCPHPPKRTGAKRGLLRMIIGTETWLLQSAKRKLESSTTAPGK